MFEQVEKNGGRELKVRFNSKSGAGSRIATVNLFDESTRLWCFDSMIDTDTGVICVSGLGELLRSNLDVGGFTSDRDLLSLSDAREAGVGEGDEVFVVGFPLNLNSPDRKHPTVRSGIISRIADAYADESNFFLIEAHSYPGASGSPVVLAPQIELDGSCKPSKWAWRLIGVVSEYVPFIDDAKSEQTHTSITIRLNSGLTRISPVDSIFRAISAADRGTKVATWKVEEI